MSPHMDYASLYDHTPDASKDEDASRMYGDVRSKGYVIDLAKPWHVAWWASQFGVSEEALLAATAEVGVRADMVALYLEEHNATVD